jgi:hypothetical protein
VLVDEGSVYVAMGWVLQSVQQCLSSMQAASCDMQQVVNKSRCSYADDWPSVTSSLLTPMRPPICPSDPQHALHLRPALHPP